MWTGGKERRISQVAPRRAPELGWDRRSAERTECAVQCGAFGVEIVESWNRVVFVFFVLDSSL